ncbi:3-hydroxyacyl-CoA dehydrogenase family protein [Nocardioides sp. GY 10127]|uniref:3-hydroxyacyl-CoA dehydrogenase family protein n=1 Tax=Nocardioides sp. GY 10127 TaxID=2569762 RepID=UPI001458E34D|nr:3-hydroxyacyl-CoA dehydrogenase family protein [Nocardioides sp. GY 10127]
MDVQSVVVVGTGRMASGIAAVFARGGLPVTVVGRSEASLARCRSAVEDSLTQLAAEGLLVDGDDVPAALARLSLATDLAAVGDTDLLVEAVVEDVSVKLDLFAEAEKVCAPRTILASASGQTAGVFASASSTPERYVAMHFWFPAPFVPLVELSAPEGTGQELLEELRALLLRLGKSPVVLRHDQSGLLGNRLQFALLREAVSLWAAGAASAEDIDLAVTAGFARRLAITGPLASADLGGLPTMFSFAGSVYPDLATGQAPEAAFGELAASGGSFVVDDADAPGLTATRVAELLRWMQHDAQQAAQQSAQDSAQDSAQNSARAARP